MSAHKKLNILVGFAIGFAAVPCARANAVLDIGAPNGVALFNVSSSLGNFNASNPFGIYEGMAIDSDTLYLSMGNPTTLSQTIWALPLLRNGAGHITSVDGNSAVAYKTVPNSGADGEILGGGLVTLAGGVLYTVLPGFLGQAVGTPGLLDLGTSGTIGGLQYIPAGQNLLGDAGKLKVSTTAGDWYTLNLSGSPGSYTLLGVSQAAINVPAFSFAYLPVDTTFTTPGVILGNATNIDLYQLDGNGNPCISVTCQPAVHLVDGVGGNIGYGLARDPVSGDLLFNTDSNQLFLLSDTFDTPEPSTILMTLAGLFVIAKRIRGTGQEARPTAPRR